MGTERGLKPCLLIPTGSCRHRDASSLIRCRCARRWKDRSLRVSNTLKRLRDRQAEHVGCHCGLGFVFHSFVFGRTRPQASAIFSATTDQVFWRGAGPHRDKAIFAARATPASGGDSAGEFLRWPVALTLSPVLLPKALLTQSITGIMVSTWTPPGQLLRSDEHTSDRPALIVLLCTLIAQTTVALRISCVHNAPFLRGREPATAHRRRPQHGG